MTTSPVPADRRLIDGGLTISVATLVEVFADHWPGADAARAPECPACGHTYTASAYECPSLAMARQLLARRRLERPKDVPEWIRAALSKGAPRLPRPRRGQSVVTAEPKHPETAELFDAAPYRRPSRTARAYGGGNH